MSSLDGFVALIDNGGTRSCTERRRAPFFSFRKNSERRSIGDRRSGTDRRRLPNRKRHKGMERRTVFKY